MATQTFRNRLVTSISNAPGTTGALTIAAASPAYRTFDAADDGLSFTVSIVDGTAWEIRTDCVYTHGTTSLSRGTLEESSTGSAINLTVMATVTVTLSAATGSAFVTAQVDAVSGGIEVLAGSKIISKIAPYYPSYTDSRFVDDTTPTLFFDPTASGSTGVGTLANPCTTWAQCHIALAVINANRVVPNTTLGIRTGINWRMATQGSSMILAGLGIGTGKSTKLLAGGDFTGLFKIVPYGSSSNLPILNGLMQLTGWTSEGGGIYSRNMATENPSAFSLPLWENGVRLKKSAVDGRTRAQTLTDLAGTGPGYYYACLASENVLYIYPNDASALEAGQIETSGVQRILELQYPDYRQTGFISISGLEMKGALSESLLVLPSAITNLTANEAYSSISEVSISGCRIGMVGSDTNISQGSADAIDVFGATDGVRLRRLSISGIESYDVMNNAVEFSGVDGGLVEYVTTADCSGKLVELWASASNVGTRYCKAARHTSVNTKATGLTGSCGVWIAPFKLTSGNTLSTSSDATVSLNNTVHHNIFDAAVGVRVSAGSGHKIHHNTLKTKGTNSASVSSYLIETCSEVDVSNNLCIADHASFLGYVKAGAVNVTGKNNCYIFDGRAANATLFTVNATPIAGASTGVNAISWQQAKTAYAAAIVANGYGVAGFDASSLLSNIANTHYINSEFMLLKGHPAIGMGAQLGYTKDIYGQVVEYVRPTVGAVA